MKKRMHRYFGSALYRENLANLSDVFFIQIGACDGKFADNIREFIISNEASWEGIFVEPIPSLFKLLKENYSGIDRNLIFENSAIYESTGKAKMYSAEKEFSNVTPTNKAGVSSLYKTDWFKANSHMIEVDTLTLEDFLKKHDVKKVDVIQLDTEGYDWHIIKNFDFKKYLPRFVVSEHFYDSPDSGFEEEKENFLCNLEELGYNVIELWGIRGQKRIGMLATREI